MTAQNISFKDYNDDKTSIKKLIYRSRQTSCIIIESAYEFVYFLCFS